MAFIGQLPPVSGGAVPAHFGLPRKGKEHVVKVRRVDGQPVHLDAGLVEAVEHGSQRRDVAATGELQGESVVVSRSRR
jgi:hypothetical protein